MPKPQGDTDSAATKHRGRTAIVAKARKEARRERQNRETTAVLDPVRQHCEDKPKSDTANMKLDAALGVTCPTIQAAATLRVLLHPSHDLGALVSALDGQVKAVNGGDLKQAEAMLLTQAYTLNELFNGLVRRAADQEFVRPYETYMRLALKAQSQCRTTLESLALIKNPPSVAFVRQANIAADTSRLTTAPLQRRAHGKMNFDRTNFQRSRMSYFRTPEHRRLRADLIRTWKPWQQSTGPKSKEGKSRVSRNADKGGARQLLRAVTATLKAQREALQDVPRG